MRKPSLIGQVLCSRYEVRDLIGQGSVARVYHGTDRRLSRSVVLKVLDASNAEVASHFQERANLASRLSHAHIVQIHDMDCDNAVPFIVMEYCRAEDLATVLRRGRLSIERGVEIALAVLDALDFAHSQGVVHGALKTSQILITDRNEVKVTDFGNPSSPANDDIQAVGKVLYEMLCGKPPQTVPPPHFTAQGVSVPPAVEDAVFKSLLAEGGFESATAFQKALRTALGGRNSNGHYLTEPNSGTVEPRRLPLENGAGTPKAAGTNGHKSATPRTPVLAEVPSGPQSRPRPTTKRSNFSLFILVAVLAVTTATSLLYVAIGWFNNVSVPNVRGMSEDVARHQLEKIGLRLVVREIQYSEDAQPGTITEQVPADKMNVRPGDAVTVVLSKGKQTVAIPNLSGMDRLDARQALEDRGLTPLWNEEFNEGTPVGRVVSQEPHSGAIADLRSQVKVVISKGPPLVIVPDLLGHNEKDCADLTSKAGLKVNSTTTKPSTEPRGQVVEQKPAPRTRVPKGSQVEIVISSGPESRSVPNMRGISLKEARQKAVEQGFSVSVDGPGGDNDDALVRNQYPEAGAVTTQGSAIHLNLEPVPSPTEADGIVVPNLVSMQLDAARTALETQGLKLGNITPEASEQPQNTVLRQTPAEGSQIKRGASVDLVIAFPRGSK